MKAHWRARRRPKQGAKIGVVRRSDGFGLFETVAALAVASLAATTALYAARTLVGTIRLDSARSALSLALLDARRMAYALETTVECRLPVGAREAIVEAPEHVQIRTTLPAGTQVVASNQRQGVRFRASGLADNATFVVADPTTDRRVTVVVNQRGGVH